MSMTEVIRIIMVKRGNIPEAELARRLGMHPQSFNRKMQRDDFKESDLRKIAEVLDCTYHSSFTLNDTGETI
jgi:IS30 family transposase